MMASRQARETDHASAAGKTGITGERIMADAMFLCLSGVGFPIFFSLLPVLCFLRVLFGRDDGGGGGVGGGTCG